MYTCTFIQQNIITFFLGETTFLWWHAGLSQLFSSPSLDTHIHLPPYLSATTTSQYPIRNRCIEQCMILTISDAKLWSFYLDLWVLFSKMNKSPHPTSKYFYSLCLASVTQLTILRRCTQEFGLIYVSSFGCLMVLSLWHLWHFWFS